MSSVYLDRRSTRDVCHRAPLVISPSIATIDIILSGGVQLPTGFVILMILSKIRVTIGLQSSVPWEVAAQNSPTNCGESFLLQLRLTESHTKIAILRRRLL